VLLSRPGVISDQVKAYKEFEKKFDQLLGELRHASAHPFVGDELLSSAESLFDRLRSELTSRATHLEEMLVQDPVRNRLSRILDGRVSSYLDAGDLKKIASDGRERYERKTPPGYQDASKPEPKRYGDLIIWNELLRRAKEKQLPLVFITDDQKEDWWLRLSGRTLGPRPELAQEFYRETSQRFHLLRTASLMELGSKYLGARITPAAIEEAGQVKARHSVPKASRAQLLRGMQDFDEFLRDDPSWFMWQTKGRHRYAILHESRLYPVKKVISLATGVPTGRFSGGGNANRLLRESGFDVVLIREQSRDRDDWIGDTGDRSGDEEPNT
jgi:hypothetical protein